VVREPLPAWVERRSTVIPAGGMHRYESAEWADALVTVSRGQIDLIASDGARHRFGRGSHLFLVGLALRGLWNPGPDEAELVAVRRKETALRSEA